MLRASRPDATTIAEYLRGRPFEFTHPFAEATRCGPEVAREIVGPGYDVDHHRVHIGEGEAAFRNAQAALRRWAQFDLGWVELCFPSARLAAGETVGVLARLGAPFGLRAGLWSLNPCRIVYTVDESATTHRFGFAYGTLRGHVESGEERFLVEWRPEDDEVWYEILAFSQPASAAVRLGRAYARRQQRRFARDSMQRMRKEASG